MRTAASKQTTTTMKYKAYLLQVFDPSGGNWLVQMGGVAAATVASFIMPMKGFLFLIGALVVADLYSGWRKAKKTTGARFNSNGMGRTLEKSCLYLILMLVSRGVDNIYHLDGTLSLSWVVGGLITGREVLSIFENADAVLGSKFSQRISDLWERITGTRPEA